MDFESACSILDAMSSIIHSPRWDAEINSFLEENSLLFNNEEENSHQHFQLHVDYIAIVNECLRERLAESGICEKEFLAACSFFQTVQDQKKNDARTNILDSLLAMGDYQAFKLLMLETNAKLEIEALQALSSYDEMISIADIKEQKNVNKQTMQLIFEEGGETKTSHSDLGVDMMGSMAINNTLEDVEEDTTVLTHYHDSGDTISKAEKKCTKRIDSSSCQILGDFSGSDMGVNVEAMATNNALEDEKSDATVLTHYHDSGDTISKAEKNCTKRIDSSSCQILGDFSGSDMGVDVESMTTNNTHEDVEEDRTHALAHFHDSDYSSQGLKMKSCQNKIVKLNTLRPSHGFDSTGSSSPKHQVRIVGKENKSIGWLFSITLVYTQFFHAFAASLLNA